MATSDKPIIVTAALPYANGPLHLGHLAGAYLPADLYVRYKRAVNADIVFICGSDEHGVPITIAAEKEGVTPQDIVDRYHEINKKAFKDLGIAFDYYGRTSSETHRATSQDFFKKLEEKGSFVKKTQAQLYDEKAGMFLPDRYVYGTCPSCSHDHAYGDQCEKCGSSLSPTDLINPKSALSDSVPVLKETEHWYLPLGNLQPKLEAWLNTKTDWKSNVLGQVKSWFNDGLADRAVTRDLTWGVPVPLENAEGKVLYVWFDAPIGYISATKEWAESIGKPDLWEKYWKEGNDSQLVHFIGKDNIVFHCIIFPSILMEYGDYVLPQQVPANEFLNLEGQKLSTSRGWAVWVHEFLADFDADLIRYALGTIMPENKDADFSWKDFQGKVNSELADILGNFLFRTLSFVHKYFDGKVPQLNNPSEADLAALSAIEIQKAAVSKAYENYNFKEAISQSMQLARIGNKYVTDSEPWKTRKTNPEACANAVYVSAQISAALSYIFDPIMPQKMLVLRQKLGLSVNADWQAITNSMLKAGSSIADPEILFKKIEDEVIEQQLQKLHEKSAQMNTANSEPTENEAPFTELADTIEFEDFLKPDLRIGTVIAAEKMKKSKKLLKLEIDLGFEKRTILSGIAAYFSAEEIVGKKVCVVANLKPRMMMGIESQGMVLMAENRDGELALLSSTAENGSKIS
jgi:methionyl-tRNA synthetase